MIRSLCKQLLRLAGWRIGPAGDDLPKCVICVAPHSSNFDLILGELFYTAIGRKAHFLIKKEWFFFPLGLLFRSIGGIPIDRNRSTSMTERLADEFARRQRFCLAITPEGTRKHVTEWKRGFYFIAQKANVPIQIAYIDYGRREVGISATFHPTGDIEADLRTIRSYYRGMRGRNWQTVDEQ